MHKALKIGLGVVAAFIVLIIIGIAAFYLAPGTALRTDPEQITGVSQYFVLKDGSLYNVRFSLVDKDNAWATSDATVDFIVKLDDGTELYSRHFDILSTDFQTYELRLTGQPVVAYAWQIDGSELQRGDLDFPKAYLTVTLPNGKTFEADTLVF